MKATKYQTIVQEQVKQGKSLIVVAPTGLGKTFAVTGDLQEGFQKTIYAVPLRALGNDIKRSVSNLKRGGQPIQVVTHHGSVQESTLFSEEFIVTTYDQIVCGAPGLPLSLPLKSGHTVAGALLLSRLIFDEAHLAWGISDQALSILLAIAKFRLGFGLQTILMTATLPDPISKLLSEQLGIERVLVGKGGDVEDDESLSERENRRKVKPELVELKRGKSADGLNLAPLDDLLKAEGEGKRIYFANTVNRLQATYDRLVQSGTNRGRIIVLHNRMPHTWRREVEDKVKSLFGKGSEEGDWILLTNQVAEAGLDISAPLVISDPAPVDTLVQRAGRCARWFREGETIGRFIILKVPGLSEQNPSQEAKDYAAPYQIKLVVSAIKSFPKDNVYLTWEIERQWVNEAWGGGEKEAVEKVKTSLNNTTFALNLFDRAAQERKPGEIARVFREILSIEVAVEEGAEVRMDDLAFRDLQLLVDKGRFPDTASISLGQAYGMMNKSFGRAAVIRYDKEENQVLIRKPDSVQLGDILILPSSMAYLHPQKGLCFDNNQDEDAVLSSEWKELDKKKSFISPGLKQRQTLSDHSMRVMEGTYARFIESESTYRKALIKILCKLEKLSEDGVANLADLIANLARVAASFHDLGKADSRWQQKVRELDPDWDNELKGLVGRSISTGKGRIGIPHTPPGYTATVEACRKLLGISDGSHSLMPLIRAVALATCRHHSSLMNPARVESYKFNPHPATMDFVHEMLKKVGAPLEVISEADKIIDAAKKMPALDEVPLMFPNEDLFPVYALVGRAILIADREDASSAAMERWK